MSTIESGNWNELPYQELREGVGRIIFGTGADDVTFQLGKIDNGNEVKPHVHEEFDQIAIILEGECDYYVDGKAHRMTPGSWVTVPKGNEHYIHVYDSSKPVINLDVFTPLRKEYDDAYTEFLEENK